ncbi:hypothetical protein MRX96_002843 [Rhipicephalus microplus]
MGHFRPQYVRKGRPRFGLRSTRTGFKYYRPPRLIADKAPAAPGDADEDSVSVPLRARRFDGAGVERVGRPRLGADPTMSVRQD